MFKSTKTFPIAVPDLAPVAEAVMQHFRNEQFEVEGQRTLLQGWDISLHKGGVFKAVLGLKTALKIQIETVGNDTRVEAGIGIFGQQAVPMMISMLLFWPVLATQIWGMVEQSKLDKEAIDTVGRALTAQTTPATATQPGPSTNGFCHDCGAALAGAPKFCPECGVKL